MFDFDKRQWLTTTDYPFADYVYYAPIVYMSGRFSFSVVRLQKTGQLLKYHDLMLQLNNGQGRVRQGYFYLIFGDFCLFSLNMFKKFYGK